MTTMVNKKEATLDIEVLLSHIIQKEVVKMLEPLQEEVAKLNLRVWDLEHNKFIHENIFVNELKELKTKVDYLLPDEGD